MSALPPASALADAARQVRAFSGRIIHRQVPAANEAALWQPTLRSWRWNRGFPALYTSLELDVALAERIKVTLAVPTILVVGVADATIARTLALTDPSTLAGLGLTLENLTQSDYAFTQDLGTAFHASGVTALLVPAALRETAQFYPRFRFTRDGHIAIRATPDSGVNLVLFTDNLHRHDAYPETARFTCEVAGIPV